MPSLHELLANRPKPDKPRYPSTSHPANPNARFGGDIVRRIQSPPPEIQRLGEFDVTRERILTAMRGEEVFPKTPPKPKASDRKRVSQADIEWKAQRTERDLRKQEAKLIHSSQARRKPKNSSAT